MWTTMAEDDSFSNKNMERAVRVQTPRVQNSARKLDDLGSTLKQTNKTQLAELENNLRDMNEVGSTKVREIVDGLK